MEKKKSELHDEDQGTRPITVKYKRGEYPGLAKGDEFLGLLCAKPAPCRPEDWNKAVAEALAR